MGEVGQRQGEVSGPAAPTGDLHGRFYRLRAAFPGHPATALLLAFAGYDVLGWLPVADLPVVAGWTVEYLP